MRCTKEIITMLLQQRIENLTNISSSEKLIADFILTQKNNIKNMSTRDIAKATFTSSSSVVRFAQRLNYSGFNELKEDYLNELHYISTHFQKIDPNFPFQAKEDFMSIAGKINSLYKETVDDSLTLIHHDNIQKATYILKNSNRIFLFSIGTAALLGEIFKQKMTRIQKEVISEYLVGEYGFHCNLIKQNDCAIFISYTGESPNVIQYAKKLKEMNIPTIVITSLGDNSLKKYADIVIHLSTREKQYSKISTFTSEYSIQFVLDVLYSCYFSLDYDTNLDIKISLSEYEEKPKINKNQNPIIKEKRKDV